MITAVKNTGVSDRKLSNSAETTLLVIKKLYLSHQR